MEKVRAHIYIKGRVQAVFYRIWMKGKAIEFGLTGWVRNLEDGRVEAVVEGEKEKIQELLKLIKIGPPLAKVYNLDIAWEKIRGEFVRFEIIN